MAAAPMEKVAIQVVCAKPGERTFARRHSALKGCVLRKDFGDEEYLVAPATNGFLYPFFGHSRQIHFRRIDVTHPEIEPKAQSSDSRSAIVMIAIPGSLTDNRDLTLGGIEPSELHWQSL